MLLDCITLKEALMQFVLECFVANKRHLNISSATLCRILLNIRDNIFEFNYNLDVVLIPRTTSRRSRYGICSILYIKTREKFKDVFCKNEREEDAVGFP